MYTDLIFPLSWTFKFETLITAVSIKFKNPNRYCSYYHLSVDTICFCEVIYFIQAIRYTNINICCFDIQNMGSIHELGYKGKVLLIRLIYIIWNMTRTGKDIKYGRKWENKFINVDMILFCQHFPLITPQFVSFLK